MAKVVLTAAAAADASAIFDELYLHAGKPTVVKYRAALKALYEHLVAFPDSGAPRPEIGPGIRVGIVSPYVAIYRHVESDNIVIVLRIVYGRRRITGRLLRAGS